MRDAKSKYREKLSWFGKGKSRTTNNLLKGYRKAIPVILHIKVKNYLNFEDWQRPQNYCH